MSAFINIINDGRRDITVGQMGENMRKDKNRCDTEFITSKNIRLKQLKQLIKEFNELNFTDPSNNDLYENYKEYNEKYNNLNEKYNNLYIYEKINNISVWNEDDTKDDINYFDLENCYEYKTFQNYLEKYVKQLDENYQCSCDDEYYQEIIPLQKMTEEQFNSTDFEYIRNNYDKMNEYKMNEYSRIRQKNDKIRDDIKKHNFDICKKFMEKWNLTFEDLKKLDKHYYIFHKIGFGYFELEELEN